MELELKEKTKAALALSKEDRILFLRQNKWVEYPRAQQILKQCDTLLKLPQSTRMKSIAIVSRTNNGKTSISKRFVERHPHNMNPTGEHIICPVLMIECPPSPTETSLYSEILHSLYEDIPRGSSSDIRNRVIEVLRNIQLRVLVIDELHNFSQTPPRAKHTFLNTLKYLMNGLSLSIVGCGTKELIQGLSIDPQLENRFSVEVLPKWKLDQHYQRLLASIETTLPLRKKSNIYSAAIAKKIYALSEGTIGETISLIHSACDFAISNDIDLIDIETINSCGYVAPSLRRKEADFI